MFLQLLFSYSIVVKVFCFFKQHYDLYQLSGLMIFDNNFNPNHTQPLYFCLEESIPKVKYNKIAFRFVSLYTV